MRVTLNLDARDPKQRALLYQLRAHASVRRRLHPFPFDLLEQLIRAGLGVLEAFVGLLVSGLERSIKRLMRKRRR